MNKLGSVPNFANPKETARAQESGREGANVSREGRRGLGRGRRRGKGLCAAVPGLQSQGGNRQSRPSRRPGSHRRTQARCPCSRTGARAPTAGALETLHLTEDSVRSPPREQASMLQPSHSWPPSPPPIRPDWRAASRSRPFSSGPYLTSFGSRPVSLRIFSSTFFRLSLAFSSCSCKVLTATAIFSLQQASRLLHRPRQAVSRRQTRED